MTTEHTRSIIVIEDDIDDTEFLKTIFRNLNYPNPIIFFQDVDAAYDYLQSIEILPALIISDLMMHKMDGHAFREKLLSTGVLPENTIPYVFFTSSLPPEHTVTKFNFSPGELFIKPVSIVELQEKVKSIVDKYTGQENSEMSKA